MFAILTCILVIHILYVAAIGSEDVSRDSTVEEVDFPLLRRIISEAAEPGEYRSVVGLQIKFANNSQTVCTGAAVNNYFALTAGHCVYKSQVIIVRINCVDLYRCKTVRRGIGLAHPKFQPDNNSMLYDLGLVRTDTSMNAPEFAQVTIMHQFYISCIGLGYGRTKDDQAPLNSRLVKLIVTEPFLCSEMFPSKEEFAHMVCSYDSDDTDLFPWDSGGPLFCAETQVGVNTHSLTVFNTKIGTNTTIMCWLTFYGFTDWIKHTISSATHNRCATYLKTLTIFLINCMMLPELLILTKS